MQMNSHAFRILHLAPNAAGGDPLGSADNASTKLASIAPIFTRQLHFLPK
jgi:hypothetical protein